jgi:hypothetical protein
VTRPLTARSRVEVLDVLDDDIVRSYRLLS